MQIPRLLQAVTLMVVAIVAVSCAASKEYSSKLFGPRPEPAKDTQAVALRFLELDKLESTDEGWVDTKLIKDSVWRDGVSSGTGEALAKQPVESSKQAEKVVKERTEEPVVETEPVAKTTNSNGTRSKTTREK